MGLHGLHVQIADGSTINAYLVMIHLSFDDSGVIGESLRDQVDREIAVRH
jgi:hypothetical protein